MQQQRRNEDSLRSRVPHRPAPTTALMVTRLSRFGHITQSVYGEVNAGHGVGATPVARLRAPPWPQTMPRLIVHQDLEPVGATRGALPEGWRGYLGECGAVLRVCVVAPLSTTEHRRPAPPASPVPSREAVDAGWRTWCRGKRYRPCSSSRSTSPGHRACPS